MHLVDGNGALVKKVAGGVTTVYVGSHYEKQGSTVIKYYSFNGQRIAMNKAGVVYYLLGDHLSSTVKVLNSGGTWVGELRYKPYGETRYSAGSTPTDYRWTGQRQEEGLGLYQMGARWVDPALSRWLSADTLVPGTAASSGGGAATLGYDDQVRLTPLTVGFHETQFLAVVGEENREIGVGGSTAYQPGPENPQMLNRYSYCIAGPLRWIDPEGHWTFAVGFGGTAGAGTALSGSVMFVFDDNGHFGIAVSGGGGGLAGVTVSGGLTFQRTNADTIQDLQGPVVQAGGSIGPGVASVGVEFVGQSEGKIMGWNLNLNFGPSVLPAEIHGVVEGTKIIVLGEGFFLNDPNLADEMDDWWETHPIDYCGL